MISLLVFGFAVVCLTVLIWHTANVISDLIVKSIRLIKRLRK